MMAAWSCRCWGHRGANRLAKRIADALEGTAAVTTAGDVALGVALDEPPAGYRLVNPADAKGAMASLLSGGGATVTGDAPWLAELPQGDALRVTVSEAPQQGLGAEHLHFAPQRAVLGLGCARDCPPEEMAALVRDTLAEAGIAPEAVQAVASIDLKADEPAILNVSRAIGVPLRLFTAAELEAEAPRLATPSEVVFAEVGCHGVSEGAALARPGPTPHSL